jgi:hypothetical protein
LRHTTCAHTQVYMYMPQPVHKRPYAYASQRVAYRHTHTNKHTLTHTPTNFWPQKENDDEGLKIGGDWTVIINCGTDKPTMVWKLKKKKKKKKKKHTGKHTEIRGPTYIYTNTHTHTHVYWNEPEKTGKSKEKFHQTTL